MYGLYYLDISCNADHRARRRLIALRSRLEGDCHLLAQTEAQLLRALRSNSGTLRGFADPETDI